MLRSGSVAPRYRMTPLRSSVMSIYLLFFMLASLLIRYAILFPVNSVYVYFSYFAR